MTTFRGFTSCSAAQYNERRKRKGDREEERRKRGGEVR